MVKEKSILMTGGAGFIGSNAAAAFAAKGWQVIVFDNFSRPGAEINAQWLASQGNPKIVKGDIRDRTEVWDLLQSLKPSCVLHLAGQVAVTTSTAQPLEDFEINLLGGINLLEGLRRFCPDASFINAATNKVYGGLESIATERLGERYAFTDKPQGIDEAHPLDFHSPYGCSKGAIDQYTIDYARLYGLRTYSLRQSCIYGPRQFGIEDQGWVAWFMIATILGRPITIFGDGWQARDLLWVDDLVAFYLKLAEGAQVAPGAYNLGGGSANVLSLRELIAWLEKRLDRKLDPAYAKSRPGDQRLYVSDIGKAAAAGWTPLVGVEEGLQRLLSWVTANRQMIEGQLSGRGQGAPLLAR